MLSFGPISSSAISALPDYLVNSLSISFLAEVSYDAVPFTAYRQLVTSQIKLAYSLELNLRVVR